MRTEPHQRRQRVINAASTFAAVALLAGGVGVVALMSNNDDPVADVGCVDDSDAITVGERGRLDTMVGSFEVTAVSLSPTGDGDVCGYMSASTIDPNGVTAPTTNHVIEISEGRLLDADETEAIGPRFYLQIDDPNGGIAQGMMIGDLDGDAIVFNGTLYDVHDGTLAAELTDLSIQPMPALMGSEEPSFA
ncbi:MAG: hypothetical protein AAGF73_17925 [Actinomycetota bacterium]